jgi:hypothetical protein
MYPVLVIPTISWLMALSAPSTLKRFLPDGALMNTLTKHHRYPKKGAKTKWAASMKNSGSNYTAMCHWVSAWIALGRSHTSIHSHVILALDAVNSPDG